MAAYRVRSRENAPWLNYCRLILSFVIRTEGHAAMSATQSKMSFWDL